MLPPIVGAYEEARAMAGLLPSRQIGVGILCSSTSPGCYPHLILPLPGQVANR